MSQFSLQSLEIAHIIIGDNMKPHIDPRTLAKLDGEIDEYLVGDARVAEREKAARRIRMTIAGIARMLELEGEIKCFGSFSNGFKTGGSDLDIVFVGSVTTENTVPVLSNFAKHANTCGFDNITKIFSANVPLVKLTDKKTTMEVDFCINNDLGVRNSQLLLAYSTYDNRVLRLGRVVKDWAKKHELVGTADGCLNSYAYMLLVLHYLQQMSPPVVPNLQTMNAEPVPIADHKWGGEDVWETGFFEDVKSLPPSEDTQSVGELLVGFFHYYTKVFDWKKHAVCMRRTKPGIVTEKYTLTTLSTNDEQWCVEDPFDLKHNLAGKCSRNGRKRIMDEMMATLLAVTTSGSWISACPDPQNELFLLKCRISQGVTPQSLLEAFEEFDLVKLHCQKIEGSRGLGQAFLEFGSAQARRRAHTKNEAYISDCQMQLHYTSQAGLAEAVGNGSFSSYDNASYQMQKKILAARAQVPGSARPDAETQKSEDSEAYPQATTIPTGDLSRPPPPPMMSHPGAFPQHGYGPMHGPMPLHGVPFPHYPGGQPPGYYGPMGPWDPSHMFPKRQGAPQPQRLEQPMSKAGPKSEAKGKAGEKGAQTKAAQKAEITAKAKIKNKSVGATNPHNAGWVTVNIKDELPSDKPLLSPELATQLEDLVAFYSQFKTSKVKPKQEHVVVQCELQNDIAPPNKPLTDHQVNLMKDLQRWCNSRKA